MIAKRVKECVGLMMIGEGVLAAVRPREYARFWESGPAWWHWVIEPFVQNPNQVLSRDQLLEIVWGDPYGVSGDQVKLYVGYLRKKLVPDAPDSAPIETVRGFGYRYARS